MMSTLVAQIAPERSTQYAALARALAPHELALSPLGPRISTPEPVRLGNLDYLRFTLAGALTSADLQELGWLATTAAYFEWRDQLGEEAGPWLRPLPAGFDPVLPLDLIATRRYRGKTNELFTHFLCNVARFSSDLHDRPWRELRVLDPLAGGGTTLFTALALGAEAAGIEHDAGDVETTASFLTQYLRDAGIACQVREERLKKLGHRWLFSIGKAAAQRCLLAHGDTAQANTLISGFRPDLIVTDLPYGIQHQGELTALLAAALPAWAALLPPAGALAFAWDATRFDRADMIARVEAGGTLRVLNAPPYDALVHRVDRVIKRRDVIVARLMTHPA
jgi:hypothetical protein